MSGPKRPFPVPLAGQEAHQAVVTDGLGQEAVEASLTRSALVLFPAVTRDGDDGAVPARLLSPQPLGYVVAIQARQADVQEYDIGRMLSGLVHGLQAAVGQLNYVPIASQQPGEAPRRVPIVVHDEDAAGAHRATSVK